MPLFLQSRKAAEVSDGTLTFYKVKLGQFSSVVNPDRAKRQDIEKFLLRFNNSGNRHAYFRAIKTFYIWRHNSFGLTNPVEGMSAPILGKPILPSLEQSQVLHLIEQAPSTRDKAIVSLFVESGLRLSELVNICPENIDWGSVLLRS